MPDQQPDLEQRIRERAYYLWLRADRPSDLADEFWNAARSAEEILQTPPADGILRWPEISTKIIKDENAKILLERADAMIKAQDDGMRAMESRMSSLLGINVTLGTAAIAAGITALGAESPLPWVQPWTIPALSILVVFWLSAILVAAFAMMGWQWAVPGVSPANLYRATFLTENTNRFRMNLAQTLQDVIAENRKIVNRYAKLLKAVVVLLAAGPVAAMVAVILIWFIRWLSSPFVVGF